MARTNQNFTMYSQNSKPIYFNIKDGQNKPVVIGEGDTFKWVMKQRGKTITSKELGNGISITNSAEGRVCVRLLPADTDNISGECDHELVMIDGDGSVTTVTTGKITVILSLHDS